MPYTNFDEEVEVYGRSLKDKLTDLALTLVLALIAITFALVIADAIFGPETVSEALASLIV